MRKANYVLLIIIGAGLYLYFKSKQAAGAIITGGTAAGTGAADISVLAGSTTVTVPRPAPAPLPVASRQITPKVVSTPPVTTAKIVPSPRQQGLKAAAPDAFAVQRAAAAAAAKRNPLGNYMTNAIKGMTKDIATGRVVNAEAVAKRMKANAVAEAAKKKAAAVKPKKILGAKR